MYVHAYQSFLWNSAVSARVASHGLSHPVEGDLVIAQQGDMDVDDQSAADVEAEGARRPGWGHGGCMHALDLVMRQNAGNLSCSCIWSALWVRSRWSSLRAQEVNCWPGGMLAGLVELNKVHADW